MYRVYENPRELEKQLKELEEAREELYFRAESERDICRRDALFEEWSDSAQEVEELKERINFAWQDEEYDEMHKDPADEEWMEERG